MAKHYTRLTDIAGQWTADRIDLVNHTYLRCRRNPFVDNPMGYFIRAMHREVTRGQFKKAYAISPEITFEVVDTDSESEKHIQREVVAIILDRLSWFDRTVMQLYIDGQNMAELSEESGIKQSTLYQSIYRTKKTIKNAVYKRSDEAGTP